MNIQRMLKIINNPKATEEAIYKIVSQYLENKDKIEFERRVEEERLEKFPSMREMTIEEKEEYNKNNKDKKKNGC